MNYRMAILAVVIFTLAIIGLSGKGFKSRAQISAAGEIWQAIDESSITLTGQRLIIPNRYRTVRVNQAALQQVLAQAPMEFTAAARTTHVVLTIPMPDGAMARFRIEESPVMEAELAARFPEIKTYRGQGIDDPTATARLGVTREGFHAIVLQRGGTVLIDPYAKGDTTNYISYFKRDVTKTSRFECQVFDPEPDLAAPSLKPALTPSSITASGEGTSDLVGPSGSVLRTYLLAVAATAEYVNVFRQPADTDQLAKERALGQMVIIMNRVNGVYERDLAIHMTLIARQLDIIYTDPLTDPYTNDAGATMLIENQSNLDAVIGAPNYDIGHVFSTGGGGVATLRVPCKNGSKARGVTGLPNPTGDVFAIDYVAHEMGHQWGGQHTFNGMAESCGTPGQRSNTASYEPGSASTIQGYAGICSTQDLQPNSDDYFHIKSLEELSFYTTGSGAGHEGNTCDDETATGNTPPVVDAGPNYTIPKDTPFELTATASDADGDALTYAWEEYDVGGAAGFSPPDDDNDQIARPIFRSYDPRISPSRMFPSLPYILNNANQPPLTYTCGLRIRIQGNDIPIPCLTGEAMPSMNRTMNFQVTVRDNNASGGGLKSDSMQVIVVSNSGATFFGPFAVTQPNTGVSWDAGTTQTVTWNVANSNLAPVNTANVKISLSSDGGNTFPHVLAESTPNDGSQEITVPNIGTSTARIKVEAVGNIFFDISDTNFSITGVACVPTNVALGTDVEAVASSEQASGNFPALAAINGDRTGANWGSSTGGWNDATRSAYPDMLAVTFAATETINQINVVTLQNNWTTAGPVDENSPATGEGILDFIVQVCGGGCDVNNNTGWTTIPGGNVTGNDKAMRVFAVDPGTTGAAVRQVRVVVNNSRNNWSRIVEVEAYRACS